MFRGRWFPLDLPRHRTHFTPDGLRRAPTQAGLRATEIGHATSTVGLAPASIQYAVRRPLPVPRRPEPPRRGRVAGLLLPLARLLDRVLGTGDELNAVAVRPGAER